MSKAGNDFVDKLIDSLDISDEEKAIKKKKLIENIEIPVKFAGIGQAGVRKTELLRSIFRIDGTDRSVISNLKTGLYKATTKDFYSFIIKNEFDLKIQFTDGPGLGEDMRLEEKYIDMWCDEIPRNDILYWVLDGPNRDIAHIQTTMKTILDRTKFHDRIVIVINKVDQFALSEEARAAGNASWDEDLNIPTDELEEIISLRSDDIIEKLAGYANVSKDRIVACSALKRWNHGKILDLLVASLPEELRYKVSANRDVKDFTELITEKGWKEIQRLTGE